MSRLPVDLLEGVCGQNLQIAIEALGHIGSACEVRLEWRGDCEAALGIDGSREFS